MSNVPSIKLPDIFKLFLTHDSLSEQEQIKHVTEEWHNIGDITNPSEVVQIAAVNANSPAIMFITNPTNTVLDMVIPNEYLIVSWPTSHTDLIKKRYKDNTVLMNKWLRYAENIRSL